MYHKFLCKFDGLAGTDRRSTLLDADTSQPCPHPVYEVADTSHLGYQDSSPKNRKSLQRPRYIIQSERNFRSPCSRNAQNVYDAFVILSALRLPIDFYLVALA